MDFSFTSHAISIPAIMATCLQCFHRLPEVHVLAIRGFEFELATGLTQGAQHNLAAATAYLTSPRTEVGAIGSPQRTDVVPTFMCGLIGPEGDGE